MGKENQWWKGKKWKKTKNSEIVTGEKTTRRKASLWRRGQRTTGETSSYGSSLQWKNSKYAIRLWHKTSETNKPIHGRKGITKQGNCFVPAKVIDNQA